MIELHKNTSATKAVILVLGIGSGREIWEDLVSSFADSKDDLLLAVTPWMQEPPSYGGPIQMPDVARGLALDLQDYEEVVIVGYSIGCYLVTELALTLGARCNSVVFVNGGTQYCGEFLDKPIRTTISHPVRGMQVFLLLAGVSFPLNDSLRRRLWQNTRLSRMLLSLIPGLVAPSALANDRIVKILAKNIGHAHLGKGLWINRHYWQTFLKSASKVKAHVTLLSKACDAMATSEQTKYFAGLFENASIEEIDEEGHCIPLEDPEWLVSSIEAIIAEQSRRRHAPRP